MNNLDDINKCILENVKSGEINKQQAIEVLSLINSNKLSDSIRWIVNEIEYDVFGSRNSYTIDEIQNKIGFKVFLDKLITLSKSVRIGEEYNEIKRVGEQEYYPLSSHQSRVFVASIIDKTGITYNIPQIINLEADLDKQHIESMIHMLIKRHEVLRTSFKYIDGVPVQIVHDDIDFKLEQIHRDNNNLNEIVKAFVRPFDLNSVPLFRAAIVFMPENKTVLVVDIHHIISDGYSLSNVLAKDLLSLSHGKILPEPKLQYKDFAVWQQKMLEKGAFQKMKKYWLEVFSGELPVSNMPLDYARPPIANLDGDYIIFSVEKEIKEKLKKLSAKNQTTLYMTLLSAYYVLLSKYTGQEDIVVGSISMGRHHKGTENIMGMFVNTLALRNYPKENKTFRELLMEVKVNTLNAFENEDFQYDELIKTLNIKRDMSRNPLFDTVFFMQSHIISESNLITRNEKKTSQFDITIEGLELDEEIRFSLEYNIGIYKKLTMERFSKHFINVLKQVVEQDDIKLCDINILSEAERNQILFEFNNTYAEYPSEKTIHQLFEEQVERTPDNIAAIYEDKQLTYRELNEKSNQLARVLRDKGVNRNSIAGLMVERSLEMEIGILAILKAGGAYLPISPDYPKDRITYMLEDSEAVVLLTQGQFMDKVDFKDTINLEDERIYQGVDTNPECINNPKDLAYIIYTSGSTGKPKGVMIEHNSAINRINWMQKKYPLNSTDIILQKTTFTFDVSVWELFWWFFAGARVCFLINGGEKDPAAIINAIERNKATTMHFVPSMLNVFLDHIDGNIETERLFSLKQVFVSGEALNLHQVEDFNRILCSTNETKLINLYGPTEASVDVSYFDCSTGRSLEVVPIGKPIDNIKLYVMDKYSNLMPVGVPGELCIAGVGLARGYINRQELTAEKFVDNPFCPGARIYKTGDLVRWLPDGNIEFLGRIDNQVKIRGYRIELGEIENKLLGYEAVKEVVVIAKADNSGSKLLCAYIVGERELSISELREHLSKDLPDYMLPSYYIQLEKLPMTHNGKVDRKALSELDTDGGISTGTEYEAPRDNTEEILVDIWRDVLEVEKIGINDNFFELGGHSLKATSLIAKIHKILNVEVPLKEIFTNLTIKRISEYIKNSEESIYSSIESVEEKDYYEMSSAQKRMYIINQMNKESISYNITKALIIEDELNIQKLSEVLERLIDRHEALRTSFELTEEGYVQKVHKKVSFSVEYIEVEREEQADEKVQNFIKAFDLSKAPLLRVGLIKVSPNKNIMVYDMHHIISDGVSMEILIKEFCMLYQGIELPKLRIQYKDYTEWLKKPYFTKRLEKQEKYWMETFKNEITPLSMPLDYDKENWKAFAGDTIHFKIKEDIVKQLQGLAIKENTTLNTLLLSLYNILLSKYCKQQDIIVGSTVANRNYTDLENMVGIFINFLPIRSNINPNISMLEYIQVYKTLLQEVYDNQDYPFDEIVENCLNSINNNRNPIFDTMLIFHNEVDLNKDIKIDNLNISPYKLDRKSATLDFKLDIILNNKNEFECYIEYNSSLYKASSMLALAKHYELLIVKTLANLESNIIDIEIFSEEEKHNIEGKRKSNNINNTTTNVVISSTFTADPLEEHLRWWCAKFRETIKVNFASYNQVFQELINTESITSKNNGINLIMVRFEDWLRDIKYNNIEDCDLIRSNYEKLIDILKNKEKNSQYIIGIFPIAAHLGLNVEVTDYIKELNNEYKDAVKNMNDVSLLDFTDIAELYNIGEVFSPISDKAGHMPFSDEYYAAIGTAIARKIHAIKHNPFKVIAVDCDNTLWKGVVGEDGALGVSIDEPYLEMQKLLIQKYNEGMLIVLSSKNNEVDVWEVFDKNPQMLLKREHLTSWKISWEPKYIGIRVLAQELNLGIDSFIFIDDNAKECYEMMANNPQVLTLQLPEDTRQIPMFLKHVWAFDKEKVTKEDKSRTKLYQVERQRQEIQKESTTLEDFLKELKLKVYINEIEEEEIPRVAQLTQRTNQFNLSTIRRTENDIESIMKDPQMKYWTIQVEDRFGEYGLTGVVIMEVKKDTAFLDTFLLSCRVLGRKVEAAILAEIGKYCIEKGICMIEADFYPTKKNKPFEEFLELNKWQLVCESEKCKSYEIQASDIDYAIDYIECYFCEEKPRKQDNVISEAATTVEIQAVEKKYISVEPNWQINVHNEEELLHKNYLMQLRYYTGKKLLEIPRDQQKYRNNNQVYEAPRNIIEEKLVVIYREVLRIEKLGINDNFFELGGNSIKLISLILKLNKELSIDIYPQKLIEMPTIKGISEHILKGRSVKQLYLLNEEKEKKIFAFPPIGGYGIFYTSLAGLIETHSLYVFDFIDTEDRIEQYIKQIIEVQKEGPYVLLGYSAGGNLTYEVALQMTKSRYEVSDIIIIDTDLENEVFKNLKEEQIDVMKIVEQSIEDMTARKKYDELNKTLDIEHFRATVERSINIFINYLRNFNIKEDKLKSNIHLLLSEALTEENREHIVGTWERAIAGRLIIYNGAGKHENMIGGSDLKHNADLLNGILSAL
ncbi:MAG: amino acid adenylation domain-containing protein [Lutisporaceae bacterium]